jgi:hypothetical protein
MARHLGRVLEESRALDSETKTADQKGREVSGGAKEAVGWDAVCAAYRMSLEDAAAGVLRWFDDAQVLSEVGEAGVFRKMWQLSLEEYDELEGVEWRWQILDSQTVQSPVKGKKRGETPQIEANWVRRGMFLLTKMGYPWR